MDKKLLKRLIALVLSGGVLISSTGVYTALAASEETTTSEYTSALVGSENAETTVPETTTDEITVPSTTEPTTSGTTKVESTTENVTESTTVEIQKPVTTQKPETTTKPPVIEEIVETPSNNGLQWVGVNGTADIGSEKNPYAVSSVEHFLAMNVVLNDIGNANKYFRLTADLDFTGYTFDSSLLNTQGHSGMDGSLVSVNPSLSSSNVFFHFDGNNKSISNITIENDEYSSLSIFGYVNAASTIENLVVNNVSIKNSYSGAQAVGIILKNDGIVKECIFTVINLDTSASSAKAESFYPTDDASLRVYTGTAIVVDNSGIIDGETGYDRSAAVVNVENVTVKTSRPYAGALVAQNRGKINKVRGVFITVNGSSVSSDYVGGLVGTNMTARTSSSAGIYYAEIKMDSRSTSVKGADKIGFLVGYNTGRVQRCTVVGDHKSNQKATINDYNLLVYGGKTAGGIVGENTGDVQLCTARDIGVYFADDKDGTIYGGIVGKTTYGVRNCIATGSTAGAGTAQEITRYIGGIVGYGDTSSNFSVENCYALVKIIDSEVPLGAIVGYNGDAAYRNNKVRNVFYSGIISSRPSPVSYGGAGEDEGDLTFSRPYAIAYYRRTGGNSVSAVPDNFDFSGWGEATFSVEGNFRISVASANIYTPTGSGTNSFSYRLTSAVTKSDKTVVNYDVNITLPSGIGASKEATILEDEPMEFGILNSQHNTSSGSGTKTSPFSLFYKDINFLYYAPAAHFIASTDGDATTWTTKDYNAPSATFWGLIDFSNNITVKYEKNATSLFKGVYGSRNDSLIVNDANNHKSSIDKDIDSNLTNGVVRNVKFEIGVSDISAIMGNICNATVTNVSVSFAQDNIAVTATESNTGLFAKSVYGDSYIYGCYIDSTQSNQYKTSSFDSVSGFIGTVDAEKTVIDNCGVNLIITSEKSAATNCAVFIGRIKSLSGGYIQNCYASGGLINSGGSFNSSNCYIFAGSIDSSSSQIYNCYFSPSYYYANNKGISLGIKSGSFTGSCKAWSFTQKNSATDIWGDITIKVTASDDTAYLSTIENIDRFPVSTYEANATALDNYFEADSFSSGATLTLKKFNWYGIVGLSYAFVGNAGASATIIVTHKATGLVAKLTVFNSSDLEIDEAGYYLIKTPVDLYYLSTHQNQLVSGSTELMYMSSNAKIKLAADIDMTGHNIESIGNPSIYFKGEFVAGQDADGRYYTISNLTFNQDNLDHALFGYVQGATIKGVHIDNASITGAAYTAALIGTVQDYAVVENCKVTNSNISGANHVGALIGGIQRKDDAEGLKITEITNCTVENTTITSLKAEKEHAYIGGIVGGIDASNQNSTRAAKISGCKVENCEITSKAYGIGGIVGYAPNNNNTITSCTVIGTNLTNTGVNGVTYASLGGVAGLFGGSSISNCIVSDSTISGECAAGIVTRLINESGKKSTIANCTVTNSKVISDNIAGGILAQVSAFAVSTCLGEKVIDGCKVSADTTVKALVAGGIIGNIQQFNTGVLTVSGCTNLGTVETTGKKGSQIDAAGGIIGRISSGMGTSGIFITRCLSNGMLQGNSNLGGIIGTTLANAHTGTNELIKDCYVSKNTEFSSKNLAVLKGIIIGFVGAGNKDNVSVLAKNVVYSSIDIREPLYGNVETTVQTGGGFDMNLGADQEKGITVDLAESIKTASSRVKKRRIVYTLQSVVGYKDGFFGTSNVVELNQNFYYDSISYPGYDEDMEHDYDGETYTRLGESLVGESLPCFSVGNLPSLKGTDNNDFETPSENVFSTSANSSKIIVGYDDGYDVYNSITDVAIQTFDKKCNAVVKTTYTGVVNGETITFDVGFTVVVKGTHAFEGTGTYKDPFEIHTAEDLLAIKQHHDNPDEKDIYVDNPDFYYEAYYRVHENIDMYEALGAQQKSFAPIGTAEDPFRGYFYGYRHYTISNMLINNPKEVKDYAYNDVYDEDKYSDAFGVFGYTNGAEISNLTFENITYTSVPSETNGFLGVKTGSIVGVAEKTTISNVEVTGAVNIEINGSYGGRAGAIGGIVGEARNDVILTDVAVKGIDSDNPIRLAGFYQVGGIVGSSADATGTSITNAVVENADIINLAISGTGIAGGIAGQYSGIITGSFVADDEGQITETRTTVNNVNVTGIVVGGVVGSGNINNVTSGEYSLTVKMTDVTNTNVEVTDAEVSNSLTFRNSVNGHLGIAGGIIGETRDSYHYLIEDCNVESSTSVISGYCAGGFVGKVMNNGSGKLQAETSLFINNCLSQANVQQLNVVISEYSGISDTVKRVTGAGSVIGVISQEANVMNKETNAPQIQITDTIAGGTVTGTFNVGGIIGEFATIQSKLNEMTGPIVSDCIVTAKIIALDNATERFGVILGSIEGNQINENNPDAQNPSVQVPFPEFYDNGNVVKYASRIFDKIFYSSYTAGKYALYGISVVKNYSVPQNWNYEEDGFAAAEALSVYADKNNGVNQTIYDVNQVMYSFKVVDQNNVVTETKLPVSVVMDHIGDSADPKKYFQWFGAEEYQFSDEFISLLEANNGSGDPFGFTIAGKDFILAEDGVQSADKTIFEVVDNPDTELGGDANRPYKINVQQFNTADLVFTYTNGLQIGLPIICGVNFEGKGTSDNPIKVANEDIFYYIVRVLPTYSFIQTEDLDFSEKDAAGNPKYPITSASQLLENFTGVYDGGGHTIEGLTANIESSTTPVGIFGKVSTQKTDGEGNIIPNVKDLTFINCTVNSGDTTAGTGVFAGAITDGATISNVKVKDSVVTSNLGTVGGIAGTVSGATTLKEVEVTGSTVAATKGSSGGVIGTITEDAVTLIAPKVANTIVISGSTSGAAFEGGANDEDIAGGIVAQAIGTIAGSAPTKDENDKDVLANAVENVTVQAFISGGAVGAVYKDISSSSYDTQHFLKINDISVAETNVVAKTRDTTRTGVAGAGLLGLARNKTDILLDNCYVAKTTNASVVAASGYQAFSAGAIASVTQDVTKLDVVDTESYATVSVTEAQKDGTVYAAGLIGYIASMPAKVFDLNNLRFDGSVAGGEISGTAMTTFVAGVIGGLNENITSEIADEFFINGVISATVENIDGDSANITKQPVHRSGKFIAGYKDEIFVADSFTTLFKDNYYSTYPQDIAFFATETGEKGPLDATLAQVENGFVNINVQENLSIADEFKSGWNSVAITKSIGSETTLFARLSEQYAALPYGSEANRRDAVAAGGFSLVETATDENGNPLSCIELVGNIYPTENEGEFELTVKPTAYGAETLVAEYTCGLKTTAQIISVEIKGTGTEFDPFLISTPTQLRVVAYLTTGNYYFRQINDIDLSNAYNATGTDTDKFIHNNGGKFYAPIGTQKSPFDGVYDGQGYKITGLRSNRRSDDNIGVFGVVKMAGTLVPVIKNLHVELMPSDTTHANGIVGGTNVGGIVGKITNGIVENCSVAVGTVTGSNNVGGIAGNFTDSKIINCFTQSDVSAFGDSKPYAAGIAGYVTSALNGAEISGCFASGSIYATPTSTSSDKSNSAGIVGYIENATGLVIDNCLFNGTTASGYGITAGNGSMNMSYSITDCIDAGQNIAMTSNMFNRIETAVAPSTTLSSSNINKTGVYYDNALLKINTTDYPDSGTGVTGLPTTKLIDAHTVTLGEGWQISAGYYPVPDVSEITVTTYDDAGTAVETATKVDSYSAAYARFLSAPMITSESEECTNINDPSFAYGKGLVYPVTLLTKINDIKVVYSSSVFDTTDTVAYPDGFDTKLYGIGENKNVDLLFEDKTTGYTSVYRNIFDTTINIVNKINPGVNITKNTYVNAGAASGNVFANGEAYYNAQVPVIYASAEIDGISVQREIKMPLSYGSTYCIATQRQLYALGKADYELAENTKFSNYYGHSYNYKLITDIDCGDNETLFTPIGLDAVNNGGYTGQFDGSGHKISNLKIRQSGKDYVGMFAMVSKNYDNGSPDPFIKNLTLEDATVVASGVISGGETTGGNYVGTLVGHVSGQYVTIENCHAIGHVEYDDKGNIISDSVKGTVSGDGSFVGGLIGKVDYPTDNITSCSSSVMVSGSKDAVGGLIGDSSGTVLSCYATGNVICNELTNGNTCGVGGLIGIMSNGTVTQSFASGNVEVKAFDTEDRYNQVTSGQFGIGGFVGYVAEMQAYDSETNKFYDVTGDVITECFSGGNVAFGTANNTSNIKPSSKTVIVGVGGFSGINREAVALGYSSAAVKATFGNIYNANDISTYGVGVGGIAGVALAGISDVYSSGSVAPAYTSRNTVNGTCYYGVGGTIGTRMNSNATCLYCYYDSWTNTDPNLTSIGDSADNNDARSLPTTELTRGKKPSIGVWSENWGYTPSAYPYLKNLLTEDADEYIKTNSILSVVCVNVADDDVSAKTGAGVTQALTVPSEFKYMNDNGEPITYNLDWAGATLEGNLAAINRTQNVREYVDVVAQIRDYEQYATRTYSRLCADMKGTFEQPYLIGNETDLAHVNMTADELNNAIAVYDGFYDQWATPLGDGGEQVEGTVHYQLMSNVSVKDVRNIPAAPASYTYVVNDMDEDGNATKIDKTFNYQGFMLKGNGYSIKDVNTTGYYILNVDENSTISNIIFENFTFTGSNSAVIGTNDGQLIDVFVKSTMNDATENVAGLVKTNNGTIDGCLVDAKISGVTSSAGIMAVNNNGTITNSGTAGKLTTSDGDTVKNVGAFVVNNTEAINNSFSMADIDVMSAAGADVQLVSGFAVTSSGTIDGVYTRTALSFENEPAQTTTVASLVSSLANGNADAVTNSYAAGLLGYYNEAQDSILFGTVPAGHAKLSSVYVDKSLAGEKSANSYKYTLSLSSMMNMQYMADTMNYVPDDPETTDVNEERGFIAGGETELVLPQLASILNAENDMVVDEDGNLIYVDTETNTTYTLFTENDEEGNAVRKYRCSQVDENGENIIYFADEIDNVVDENGRLIVAFSKLKLQYSVLLENKTIIRNYDVIKAYSKISSMTLKTAQSQYADRLAPNSSDVAVHGAVLDSQVSATNGVQFAPVSGNNIIGVNNATRKLQTNNTAGLESIRVNYNTPVELSRGMEINPELLIDVGVSKLASINLNPNFNGGIGTKENPYRIAGTPSLTSLHYYGTESNLYFILDADIEMKDVDDFQIHVFTAHLNDPESTGGDTAQYVIKNFTSTKGEGGLFGRIENGAVVNNVALTGTVSGTEQYTGALANVIDGATVTNCVVSADVTSTAVADEYSTPATGVLAGRITNTSHVSGIVTTGNVTATAGAVGGVAGFAENTAISEIVSTANVGEGAETAGIIGTIGENATLTNALYGGEAESGKPIVANLSETATVTDAYYDKQINKGIEDGTVIGEGKTSKDCKTVFGNTVDSEGNALFTSIGKGFYPVPAKMSDDVTSSYDAVTAFATNVMTYYLGSSRGEKGYYTSMQFENTVSGAKINVSENPAEGYFTVDEVGNVYIVKTAKYNESKNPEIVLSLDNGAIRTVHPGLVRNANISYTIVNSSDLDVSGKLLGVLFKSVADKTSTDSVNALNDFSSEIGVKQTVDALVIADDVDGFFVGEMLPDGYEYKITATLNGVAIDESDITKEDGIYGTFIKLPTTGEGDIQTLVEITLEIVKSDKPWGVNSVRNILW